MRFTLDAIAGLSDIARLPGCAEATPELAAQILDEGGKFAANVLAPLYRYGDMEGARLDNGVVRTPRGWTEAYKAYVDGGWPGVPFDSGHGGQGLPWTLATPLAEMWNTANLGWALCPMLTAGAAEALAAHGTPWQKATLLPRLVSGEWTGTMNLTEPQAGSDLGAIRCRAVPDGDAYRLSGQKIFITYGDHELAENIVHLVLARTPGAPEGVRGISLFAVPKYLVGAEGRPGARNDVRCVRLENKLGIHASPTCVMAYGENGGALGTLVGEEGRGLECMFTMMNNERLAVGLQGVAVAERAYQLARAYARERRQGRDGATGEAHAPIIRHADVRRMLMTMRALTEAGRALCYAVAAELDRAKRQPDEAARKDSQALVDFLTPVVKAWCTDTGVEVASLGIQVHGGMGFIEDTGAAQILRDARITPIYEGTNGIQARDLVGRKLLREGGATAARFAALVDATAARLTGELAPIGQNLAYAVEAYESATAALLATGARTPEAAAAVAVPYLELVGVLAGGWVMARAAAAEEVAASPGFRAAKRTTARFYADAILPRTEALETVVRTAGPSILGLAEDAF
ncbi:MAG: acyl-CoA dehydrogenase [Alphaproteobacteria bacterium]|nr:acyl-CoA dehydrogenase [Alphaproteobacteria bacterium]